MPRARFSRRHARRWRLAAAQFAAEVDFFSIGTNDLTQFTLAAERGNPRVARLSSPFEPAVVELVRQVVEAAHARGRRVGVCGEMAGDPAAVPLLVGRPWPSASSRRSCS